MREDQMDHESQDDKISEEQEGAEGGGEHGEESQLSQRNTRNNGEQNREYQPGRVTEEEAAERVNDEEIESMDEAVKLKIEDRTDSDEQTETGWSGETELASLELENDMERELASMSYEQLKDRKRELEREHRRWTERIRKRNQVIRNIIALEKSITRLKRMATDRHSQIGTGNDRQKRTRQEKGERGNENLRIKSCTKGIFIDTRLGRPNECGETFHVGQEDRQITTRIGESRKDLNNNKTQIGESRKDKWLTR